MPISINGSGTVTGISVGGLPDGIVDTDMLAANAVTAAKATGSAKGITVSDSWIITTAYTSNSAAVMDSNWVRQVDNMSTTGVVGSAMTQSSGVFTFPTTGIWLICLQVYFITNGGRTYVGQQHQLSTDSGSNFTTMLSGYGNGYQSNAYIVNQTIDVYDITNTSTHKLRFRTEVSDTVSVRGTTAEKRTGATFIRLGDT